MVYSGGFGNEPVALFGGPNNFLQKAGLAWQVFINSRSFLNNFAAINKSLTLVAG